GEGTQDGFLTNIVGNEVPGTMPNDAQLEAEYVAAGASVSSIDRIETEAGEAARAVYELETPQASVKGEALSIATDDSVVSFTVSSGDAEQAARLMDGIVETLAAD